MFYFSKNYEWRGEYYEKNSGNLFCSDPYIFHLLLLEPREIKRPGQYI